MNNFDLRKFLAESKLTEDADKWPKSWSEMKTYLKTKYGLEDKETTDFLIKYRSEYKTWQAEEDFLKAFKYFFPDYRDFDTEDQRRDEVMDYYSEWKKENVGSKLVDSKEQEFLKPVRKRAQEGEYHDPNNELKKDLLDKEFSQYWGIEPDEVQGPEEKPETFDKDTDVQSSEKLDSTVKELNKELTSPQEVKTSLTDQIDKLWNSYVTGPVTALKQNIQDKFYFRDISKQLENRLESFSDLKQRQFRLFINKNAENIIEQKPGFKDAEQIFQNGKVFIDTYLDFPLTQIETKITPSVGEDLRKFYYDNLEKIVFQEKGWETLDKTIGQINKYFKQKHNLDLTDYIDLSPAKGATSFKGSIEELEKLVPKSVSDYAKENFDNPKEVMGQYLQLTDVFKNSKILPGEGSQQEKILLDEIDRFVNLEHFEYNSFVPYFFARTGGGEYGYNVTVEEVQSQILSMVDDTLAGAYPEGWESLMELFYDDLYDYIMFNAPFIGAQDLPRGKVLQNLPSNSNSYPGDNPPEIIPFEDYEDFFLTGVVPFLNTLIARKGIDATIAPGAYMDAFGTKEMTDRMYSRVKKILEDEQEFVENNSKLLNDLSSNLDSKLEAIGAKRSQDLADAINSYKAAMEAGNAEQASAHLAELSVLVMDKQVSSLLKYIIDNFYQFDGGQDEWMEKMDQIFDQEAPDPDSTDAPDDVDPPDLDVIKDTLSDLFEVKDQPKNTKKAESLFSLVTSLSAVNSTVKNILTNLGKMDINQINSYTSNTLPKVLDSLSNNVKMPELSAKLKNFKSDLDAINKLPKRFSKKNK